MARYALLPTPGDPAVVTFWKLFHDRVWGHLFDKLVVYYNPPPELAPHAGYVRALFDAPDVLFLESEGIVGHGEALKRMVCHESIGGDDVVTFFEDDAITFKADELASCLVLIENDAHVVGSPRGSATPALIEAENQRFHRAGGQFQAGEDTGPNFWPHMFITRKSLLMQTDLDFAARGWDAGERIAPLNWTPDEPQAGDTMVWMSIQVRALTRNINLVPQWHSSPYDLHYATHGTGIWADDCEWFHIGSLSSLPLGCDLSGVRDFIKTEADRLEWERRLMYVWLAAQEARLHCPDFGLFYEYREWITGTARQLSLNVDRMVKWMAAYRRRLEGALQ